MCDLLSTTKHHNAGYDDVADGADLEAKSKTQA